MHLNGVEIEDEYAEAFKMAGCRVVVTAIDAEWAMIAARSATGYGSSVIACDAEAGIECVLSPEETPDGRPGVSLLFFSFKKEPLEKAVTKRVGQCVMTCATTACYDGLPKATERMTVGGTLRFFGDGFQSSKLLDERRYWRIPTMDGEFLCEESFGAATGVGGGNFFILAKDQQACLTAAKTAVAAIHRVEGVITPFPGGVVRSGSKVGSKAYKNMIASTNDAYCPGLRGTGESRLPPEANCVLEVIIDGLSLAAVKQAMQVGVRAACLPGVVKITAGNYGGKLGKHLIRLHELFSGA
jgi:formylmethanofuran--tetrahydromethanopterin N-formyltransferase